MEHISPEHPTIALLVAYDRDPSDEQTVAMREAAAALASSRSWSVAPPSFIDESDDSSCTQPNDLPIRTVGIALDIYSSFPPWGEQLPPQVDRIHFDEVTALLARLAPLTANGAMELSVELNGELIGAIGDGVPDENITLGLMEEWRRVLERRGVWP